MEKRKILVTGAAGNFGLPVIRCLKKKGSWVRGLAYQDNEVEIIRTAGADEIFKGDLRNETDLRKMIEDIDTIYYICPRLQPDEHELGVKVIAAAEKANLSHFVYHSVVHPPIEEIDFHWAKMRVELELLKSSLCYTIIQPTNLMQNIRWTWDRILQDAVYTLPYSADVRLTWVDVNDVAEAVAAVMTNSGHEYATYELAGPDGPLTRHQICDMVSQLTGKTVRAETQAVTEYIKRTPRCNGLSIAEKKRIQSMFEFYNAYGLTCGNHNVLEMLLQHPATDYKTCLSRMLK